MKNSIHVMFGVKLFLISTNSLVLLLFSFFFTVFFGENVYNFFYGKGVFKLVLERTRENVETI